MAHSVHLSDEAYSLLTALKEEGESYSDVVTRLASSRRELSALRNLSGPREDFDLERTRERMAEADQRRFDELVGSDRGDEEAS